MEDIYVASVTVDSIIVRIRKSSRKPCVTIEPSNIEPSSIKILRASTGRWICSVENLSAGSNYDITVNKSRKIQVQTLDDRGLGNRLLRLGILTDTHLSFQSYNGKRLYGSSRELMEKYTTKLAKTHRVDCIVLPGDVCDTGSQEELQVAASILSSVSKETRCFPIVGNHEMSPSQFAAVLTPQHPEGYYSVTMAGGKVHLVLLATDTQESLNKGTAQLEWLQHELANISKRNESTVTLVFLHFSLLLHPLHNQGRWDDGLQLLDQADEVLDLLHSYPTVKAVMAGHKNVPSKLVDGHGLLHTLSPQLIQVPCGYDVVDVYERGLLRSVHEIDEMDLQDVSRRAAGEREAQQRWGKAQDCWFRHEWTPTS